jgi:hypothetical protein
MVLKGLWDSLAEASRVRQAPKKLRLQMRHHKVGVIEAKL